MNVLFLTMTAVSGSLSSEESCTGYAFNHSESFALEKGIAPGWIFFNVSFVVDIERCIAFVCLTYTPCLC